MVADSNLMLDLRLFVPELILVGTIIILFLLDAIIPATRKNAAPIIIAGVACLGAGFATACVSSTDPSLYFSGLLANDSFTNFFRYLLFFTAGTVAYLAYFSKELEPKNRMEFTILLLCLTFGCCLMVGSTHLLMLYIGIETVSIISYVMAGFSRDSLKSNEASFKYLVFGALSSALMLYGFSLIYGYTGSLTFEGISTFLQANGSQAPEFLYLTIILVYAGIAFKISAFPMHFWTPDVYEGAPTPVVAFFSVAPKAAGFAVFIRMIVDIFAVQTEPHVWQSIEGVNLSPWLATVAAITMVVGNLSAIGQTNAKRMMAYSSIAHVGYMLMGLVALSSFGIEAILFYILAYCAMNIGAFWCISVVSDLKGHDDIDAFNGVGWTMPVLGTCMCIFLFSLAGIPMFAGFIGKWYLFGVIMNTPGYFWLALLAVVNSVISLYYYAKIFKAMWLEKPQDGENVKLSYYHGAGIVSLAVPTVVFGLYFTPIIKFLKYSLTSIL